MSLRVFLDGLTFTHSLKQWWEWGKDRLGRGVAFGEKVTSPTEDLVEFSCIILIPSGAEAVQQGRPNEALHLVIEYRGL